MRRLIVLAIGGATLLGSGAYFFVYLYRWEWNRALVSGTIFLGVELALIGLAISSRLTRLTQALNASSDHPARRTRIAARLRESPNEPSVAFAWLRSNGSSPSVFIPILMGTGLALSAAAWLVERLGRATARSTADPHLAARMSRLGPPPGGLLDDSTDPLRLLRHPASPR